ncbi:hypothetical protein BOX15_Mlig026086g1, partial [Macrostomum lignano]
CFFIVYETTSSYKNRVYNYSFLAKVPIIYCRTSSKMFFRKQSLFCLRRKTLFMCCIVVSSCIILLIKTFPSDCSGDYESISDRLEELQEPAQLNARIESNSSEFNKQYAELLRLQDSSMFFIQRRTRMPLMRLEDQERNFSYRAQIGRQWMLRKNVVFVATVQNARVRLRKNIDSMHRLGKLFNDYWLIFVENDSTDGTRELLHEVLQKNNQTVILGCQPINSRAPCKMNIKYRSGKLHRPGWGQKRTEQDRIDRGVVMSVLRNMYLDYIYDNLKETADLVIVTDPDIEWKPWSLDNIAQGMYYFSAKPKLDILCANTRLNNDLYDPCARSYFSKKRYTSVTEYDRSIITDKIATVQNSIPVKVESCFSAFAIYRARSIATSRLRHYPVPEERSCEHNTLARRLQEIYIDPAMKLVIRSQFAHA